MINLHMRMFLLLAVLFGIIYAIVVMIGTSMGMQNFYAYLFISFIFMFIQYLIGPKMVEWSMRLRYVSREQYPELFTMIEEQARQAGIAWLCLRQRRSTRHREHEPDCRSHPGPGRLQASWSRSSGCPQRNWCWRPH